MWILALIFDALVALLGGEPSGSFWSEDLKNRNDRGLLKKPSDKYIC